MDSLKRIGRFHQQAKCETARNKEREVVES